jgi:hypothetical protein
VPESDPSATSREVNVTRCASEGQVLERIGLLLQKISIEVVPLGFWPIAREFYQKISSNSLLKSIYTTFYAGNKASTRKIIVVELGRK